MAEEGLNARDIIEAIKDSSDRQERAMGILSSNMQGLAEAVAKGFAKTSSPQQASHPLILLSAVAAVIFGLMSPIYQRMGEQDAKVTTIDNRMEIDNDRERIDAAKAAAARESLNEVKSRLSATQEMMDLEHGILARSAEGTESSTLRLAIQTTELRERIRALEQLAGFETPPRRATTGR